MSAPTRIAATFVGGSLDGKWTYLPLSGPECGTAYPLFYLAPDGKRYELVDTIWHSEQDSVMSHQVYRLVKRAKAGT